MHSHFNYVHLYNETAPNSVLNGWNTLDQVNYDPYEIFPDDFRTAMAIEYGEPEKEVVTTPENKYSAYPELAHAYRQIIHDDTLSFEEKQLMISSLDEMYDRDMEF